MGTDGDGTGPGDGSGGIGQQGRRGRVARVGDEPLIFTLGMITIGLLIGVYLGLLTGGPAEQVGGDADALAVREDLDSLSDDVSVMTAVVDELDARAAGAAIELAWTRTRLDSLREDLATVGSRLEEVREGLERLQGPVDRVSGDLDDLRVEILDLRMELVGLQLEMDDLVARILEGGTSGGGGGPTVPENATALPTPHLSHYTSPLMDPTCGMCHDAEPAGEIIVSGGRMYWNGSLDDPAFNTVIDRDAECVECHGQFSLNGMDPGYIDVSCVACHDDWSERMTSPYVREGAVADDECLLCHGGPNAFIDVPQDYGGSA